MEEPGKTTSAWRDSSTVAPPSDPPPLRQPSSGGTFKKVLGPLAIIGILLAKFGKLALVFLKFIPALLKTGGSMFLMIWIYAMQWGWWYAFGFVLLLSTST